MANWFNYLTAEQIQSTYGWADSQPIPIPRKNETVEFPILEGKIAKITRLGIQINSKSLLTRVKV